MAALRVSAADDPTRSAFSLGYTDCAAGLNALQVAVHSGTAPSAAVPAQAESGYLNGFNYGVGAATAHTDAASMAPVDPDQAAGHGDYGAGLAAARTNLASPPQQGAGTAHAGYLSRLSRRPRRPVLARAAGHRRGDGPRRLPARVPRRAGRSRLGPPRRMRRPPRDTPTTRPERRTPGRRSRTSTARSRPRAQRRRVSATTATALPPPAPGARPSARAAFDQGHSDFRAGWVDPRDAGARRHVVAAAAPTRAESGYLRGFEYARGGVAAHIGTGVPTPGADVATGMATTARADRGRADLVTAPGDGAGRAGAVAHAAYVAGYQAARVDLASVAPATAAGQAGHGDYRAGVDAARANLASPAPAESAAAAGHADDLSGAAQARSTLAALDGAAPAPSGEAAGFGDYRTASPPARRQVRTTRPARRSRRASATSSSGAQAADDQIQAGTQPSAVVLRAGPRAATCAGCTTPPVRRPRTGRHPCQPIPSRRQATATMPSASPRRGPTSPAPGGRPGGGARARRLPRRVQRRAREPDIRRAAGHAAETGHLDYISGYTVARVNLASAAPLESAAAQRARGLPRNGCLRGQPRTSGSRCRRRALPPPGEPSTSPDISDGTGGRHISSAADERGGPRATAITCRPSPPIHQAYLTTGVAPVFFAGTAAASALADYISGVTAAQNSHPARQSRRTPPRIGGFSVGQRPRSGSKRKAL